MTTYPTPVGHVIPKGATEIPDDVLGIEDRDGASATRVRDGWLPALCAEPGMRCQGHDDAEMLAFAPLTVTAVREPEPAAELPRHVAAILDDLKPAAPVDVLDLVRQYGTECLAQGAAAQRGSAPDQKHAEREAKALLRKIEAALRPPADSSVLSLPSVPEGTVALIDRNGDRWENTGKATTFGNTIWRGPNASRTLAGILSARGPVSVVMREPRTWPRLDGAPGDLTAVRGRSGTVYVLAVRRELGSTTFIDKAYVEGGGVTHTLSDLQEWDGPLTEVFDEPGGQP